MGERHQVYIKTKKNYDKPEATITGLHHQWLYGFTALRLLRNTLKFHKNGRNSDYNNHSAFDGSSLGEQVLINALYSTDYETGYFHQVHSLTGSELTDPRHGDNNTGITVIDFTPEGKPKVAFIKKINSYDEEIVKPKVCSPLSYFKEYYKLKDLSKEQKDELDSLLADIKENSVQMTSKELWEIFPALTKESLSYGQVA